MRGASFASLKYDQRSDLITALALDALALLVLGEAGVNLWPSALSDRYRAVLSLPPTDSPSVMERQ